MLFIAEPGLSTSFQFHLKEVLNPSQSSHRISAFAALFKSSTLLIFHCQAPPMMFPRAKVTWVALSVNFEGFILKYRPRLVQNLSASSFFLVNFLISNLTPLASSAMMAVMSGGGDGGGDGSFGGLGGSMIIGSVSVGLNGSSSSICLDNSWVRMSGLSSRGTPAILVGSSC